VLTDRLLPAAVDAHSSTTACRTNYSNQHRNRIELGPLELGMTEVINNTLYALTAGSSLHLDHDAVRIHHPDHPAKRLPLVRIDHIVAFVGATISDS